MTRPLGTLIPEALIKELQRRFPNQVPDLSASDREVWAAVGEQQVIGFLQREYEGTHSTRRASNDDAEDF